MDGDDLADLFASVPDLRLRRMFGGLGIYDGEIIIALKAFDTLFLKTDEQTEALFCDAGSARFTYHPAGRAPVQMPYFACPPEAFDDPDTADYWIGLARDAGRRSFAAKQRRAAGRG